jgi:hypothetical protein
VLNHQSVIQRMQAQVSAWEETADRRTIFLSCYMLMTGNMLKALDGGEFIDARWVDELLHHFADYYFEALDLYEQDRQTAPPVWQLAFNATHAPQTLVLQNLILGVNAHINYDLVLTLVDMLEPEWMDLSEKRRKDRYADHCQVNDIIGRTIDAVQDQIVEQAEPTMNIIDVALGPVDEWLTSRLISHWREQVWQNALRLVKTPDPGLRERVRLQIEATALERAEAVLFKGGSGGMIRLI